MPGIDKKAFLNKIAKAKPMGYGNEPMPGEGSPEEEAGESPEEEAGEMTCGEQLMAAVKANDAAGVDAALKEAAVKYGR